MVEDGIALLVLCLDLDAGDLRTIGVAALLGTAVGHVRDAQEAEFDDVGGIGDTPDKQVLQEFDRLAKALGVVDDFTDLGHPFLGVRSVDFIQSAERSCSNRASQAWRECEFVSFV
jgi:hypothetical protein